MFTIWPRKSCTVGDLTHLCRRIAYGAVVYLKVIYESGSVSSRLVAAKTRVAPLAATSIPRLELMAAILGLRLTESVSRVYSGALGQAVFGSDSMNVLWWIKG